MPVVWEYRDNLLVVRGSGLYPNSVLEDAVRSAVADPRFRPGTLLLWDGRVSEVPLSSADIEWRVELVASLVDRGLSPKVAVLLREGLLDLTLEHSRSDLPSGLAFRAFASEEEAIRWLREG